MDQAITWLPQLRRYNLTRLCLVQYCVGAHLDSEANDNEIPSYCELVYFVLPSSASKIMERPRSHVILLESESRRSIIPSLSCFLCLASPYLPEQVLIQFVLQKAVESEIAAIIPRLKIGHTAIFEEPLKFSMRSLYESKSEKEVQIHQTIQERIRHYTEMVRRKPNSHFSSILEIQQLCLDYNLAKSADDPNLKTVLQDLAERKFVIEEYGIYYLNDPMRGRDPNNFIPPARANLNISAAKQGPFKQLEETPLIITYTSGTPSMFICTQYGVVDLCNGANILNLILQETFSTPVSWQEVYLTDGAGTDSRLRFEATLYLKGVIVNPNAKYIGRASTKKLARKEACYLCCYELFHRGLIK